MFSNNDGEQLHSKSRLTNWIWLTLVTCKEYDEKTNTYRKRLVVRAALVRVEGE